MKKYIKWIILTILIVIGIFFIKLPSLVQSTAIKRLETLLGRRVSSGKVKYNYARNILYMEDFNIYEEDRESFFVSFKSLNVNIDIFPLIRSTFYVKELTMVEPFIWIKYEDGVGNFQGIIENIDQTKSTEAIQTTEEAEEEESFIKKFHLENLTIESFILSYEDQIITAENNFTLETPELLYENGIFKVNSTLDFYDKGSLEFNVAYNNNGDMAGILKADKLLLDDKLYLVKAIHDLSKVEGIIDSTLEFSGNINENDYTFSGDFSAKGFELDSNEQGKLISMETFKTSIEEITPSQKKYLIKDIEALDGDIDIIKITDYLASTSDENAIDEEEIDNTELPLNIRLDSLKIKEIDILSQWGALTKIEGTLQEFTGQKDNKFPLDLAFTYEENTSFKINSVNTLKDGLNITKETLYSQGQFTLDGNNISFIEKFLPEDKLYTLESEDINYQGKYSYSYPDISLSNNISIKMPIISNITEDYPRITTDTFTTNNNVEYDLLESNYRVFDGDIFFTNLLVLDPLDETVISTSSTKIDLIEISSINSILSIKNNISMETPALNNISEDYPNISTDTFIINNGHMEYNLLESSYKILDGDISLDNLLVLNPSKDTIVSTKAMQVSLKEVSSDNYILDNLDISRLFVDLEKIQSKDEEDTQEESTYPKVMISKLNITDSEINHQDFKLNIDFNGTNIGTLKSESNINFNGKYNNSPIKIVGNLKRPKDLKLNKDLDFIGFKGDVNISTFNLEDLDTLLDLGYNMTGYGDLNSQVDYNNKNLSSKNNISLKNLYMKSNDTTIRLESLTSKNYFSLKKDIYSIKGDMNLDNTLLIEKDLVIKITKTTININSITPKEVILKDLIVVTPQITINNNASKATPKITEVETKEIKKTIEKERAQGKKPLIFIKNFTVKKGRIDYNSSNLKYHIKDIQILLENFTTEKQKNFKGEVSGGLTGSGRVKSSFTSSLEREWDFNPTSFNIDGDFNISNLKILDFKNFLITKLPNEITSGKVNYDSSVKLKKGKFKGDNIITINSIYIGKETGVESTVPLKLAVGVLKDRNGNLELDVPISGDFNDPKFRIYRVVLQAIKNILIKAVTSPVNILSRAFHLGSDEVIAIEYNYLETSPKSGDKETLGKLVTILKEKKDVNIVFTIFTNRDEEKRVLNESLREKMIFKRDTKEEDLEEQVDEILESRKIYMESYFKGNFLGERVEVEISDIPRSAPVSNIDFLIKK